MYSALYQIFFVDRAISWLLSKDRNWNRKSTTYGALLAVFGLLIVSSFGYSHKPNLYELLQVKPKSPKPVLQSAFRRLSLQYHPDANPEKKGDGTFEMLSGAQQILTDADTRNLYHRFGDLLDRSSSQLQSELYHFSAPEKFLWLVLMRACFDLSISFLFELIYSGSTELRRRPYRSYQWAIYALEVFIRFAPESDDLFDHVPFMGQMLPYEQLKVLHALSPLFFHIGTVIESVTAKKTDILDTAPMKAAFLSIRLTDVVNSLKAYPENNVNGKSNECDEETLTLFRGALERLPRSEEVLMDNEELRNIVLGKDTMNNEEAGRLLDEGKQRADRMLRPANMTAKISLILLMATGIYSILLS